MTPENNGRHCSSCSKVVVDFTSMSENQIKEFFRNNTGKLCGRIHVHQLNPKYTYPSSYKAPWYAHRILQYALSGLLTLKVAELSAVEGQSINPDKISLIKNDIYAGKNISTPTAKTKKIIAGKVLGHNGHKLENATVNITETGQTVLTDSNGRFSIELPDNYKEAQITITISYSVYESEIQVVDISTFPVKKLTVHMKFRDDHIIMGDIKYIPE